MTKGQRVLVCICIYGCIYEWWKEVRYKGIYTDINTCNCEVRLRHEFEGESVSWKPRRAAPRQARARGVSHFVRHINAGVQNVGPFFCFWNGSGFCKFWEIGAENNIIEIIIRPEECGAWNEDFCMVFHWLVTWNRWKKMEKFNVILFMIEESESLSIKNENLFFVLTRLKKKKGIPTEKVQYLWVV